MSGGKVRALIEAIVPVIAAVAWGLAVALAIVGISKLRQS